MSKKKIKRNLSPELVGEKFGAGILSNITVPIEEELFIPTDSPIVNYMLGGGFLYGRIAEIAGYESSGKTLLAMHAIKGAQALGGVGIFVDAEFSFSRDWAEKNGIDIDNLYLYSDNTIEKLSDFLAEISIAYRSELVNNEPILIVVDSVAALDSFEVMAESEETRKAEMGRRARKMGDLLRLRNRLWSKLGITIIFINQLRDTIETGFAAKFGDQRTTPGGHALRFYASQRIYLETKKVLTIGAKENKRKVGVEVAFEMKKNKISIPKATRRIPVIFHPDGGTLGFSKFAGLESILKQEGVLEKRGGSYYFGDENLEVSNEEELYELFEEDPELVSDICAEANIMTIEEMEHRLDEETENKFPVTEDLFPKADKKDE